ncbi:IS66 family insertion sequence element accessory protein TnpB [Lacticaseibacillus paracasei]|uniref:IS66 family insertion sequence element accessory protein TnpB n=1 Tax=Lacticaseibacillus paracasei TaxID=1597 RepID=UPI0021D107BD|nr:IS66 family insertion sequence element accessory protein TnpB [Lacticaseibacillus paracasei]MCU6432043.1 IS66 family insertion sequence element accessory protein TnpB [Lacticaseibacillus paracasei]
MIPDLSNANIYIVCGHTDLRKGVDGLAILVTEEYKMGVFDNALFIFCGTRKDRFKALYWNKSVFLLLYKCFENGYMQWPRDRSEIRRLNYRQMSRLVNGLAIEERRTIRPIIPRHVY